MSSFSVHPNPSPVPSSVTETDPSRRGFVTRSVHGGLSPDPTTGAILTPIYQSTTFVQEAVGVDKGYTYTRAGNPTVAALERNIGALEDALPAACFATGMAATTALTLTLLRAGDHVVCGDVVYGGTVRLLRQVFDKFGVSTTFVDGADTQDIAEAVRPETKLIFIETPANPTLKLTDIEAVATIAYEHDVPLIVDNTFLTPALQRPLDLGATVSLYSTTKYFDGHNATVGGALVTRDEALLKRIRFTQKAIGFAQAPFEAWLTLQGIKTMKLRLDRQSTSAHVLARFLEDHAAVDHVFYPGLESFPQYVLARRQQATGGAMIAFEVKGGVDAGVRFINALELCSLAENLGSVQTLVTHPVSMTHADVPVEQRRVAGITNGLIRLSVGLEEPADLLADLARALRVAGDAS